MASLRIFLIICAAVLIIKPSMLWAASLTDPYLTWSPPQLSTTPSIITIQKSPRIGFNRMIISRTGVNSDIISDIPEKERILANMTPDEDVVVKLPTTDIISTAGLHIHEGHNVVLIGGHLKATIDANKKIRALLRTAGQTGNVFIEGVILDQNNKTGLDGFEFGGLRHKPDQRANIYFQNSACINGSAASQPYHADCVQPYGPTKYVYLDKIKIRAQLQGFFFDPQHDHDGFDLRRIDADYTDPTQHHTKTGYICYLHFDPPEPIEKKHRPPFHLQDVYCGERQTAYGVPQDGWWSWFSIYPPAKVKHGAKTDTFGSQATKASFPAFPEIKGFLLKGPPPVEIVDEEKIGLRYTSPGYIKPELTE